MYKSVYNIIIIIYNGEHRHGLVLYIYTYYVFTYITIWPLLRVCVCVLGMRFIHKIYLTAAPHRTRSSYHPADLLSRRQRRAAAREPWVSVAVAVRRRVYNYYYYYWTGCAHDAPPPRPPTTKSSAAAHYRGPIERLWRNLDETIARPDRTPCDEIYVLLLLSQYFSSSSS